MTSTMLSPVATRPTRATARRRTVVAAASADATGFDAVMTRAMAHAADTDEPLVVLTVVTQRPLTTQIDRVRARLARLPAPVSLVASWVDLDGLDPAERSAAIAAEIVRGAGELAASTLVVGPTANPDPALSLVSEVARTLPVHTTLSLGETPAVSVHPPPAQPARGELELTAGTVERGQCHHSANSACQQRHRAIFLQPPRGHARHCDRTRGTPWRR